MRPKYAIEAIKELHEKGEEFFGTLGPDEMNEYDPGAGEWTRAVVRELRQGSADGLEKVLRRASRVHDVVRLCEGDEQVGSVAIATDVFLIKINPAFDRDGPSVVIELCLRVPEEENPPSPEANEFGRQKGIHAFCQVLKEFEGAKREGELEETLKGNGLPHPLMEFPKHAGINNIFPRDFVGDADDDEQFERLRGLDPRLADWYLEIDRLTDGIDELTLEEVDPFVDGLVAFFEKIYRENDDVAIERKPGQMSVALVGRGNAFLSAGSELQLKGSQSGIRFNIAYGQAIKDCKRDDRVKAQALETFRDGNSGLLKFRKAMNNQDVDGIVDAIKGLLN